jgi:hypothetical protein
MSDARNIAKPLTPSKSKYLTLKQIDALSRSPRQTKGKHRARPKLKTKIRPTHDDNTVTLRLNAEQVAVIREWESKYAKLFAALVEYNIEQRSHSGRYLRTIELQRVAFGKRWAVGLPRGAGQTAANEVVKRFIAFTSCHGESELDATLGRDNGITMAKPKAKRGKLQFPKPLGEVGYVAPTAVTGLLESTGIRLYGAYLYHRRKLWRAEMKFERVNEKQITQDIKLALAVAQGYVEPDDGQIVDECLFEIILNLASTHGLELDHCIPSTLIQKRLVEHRMTCHKLKQRLEQHGVNEAKPRTWTGELIEGLGKRPMSYSVREIYRANAALYSERDDA